jgi:hypothetical protein
MNKNSVKTPNLTFIGDNPSEHRRRLKERVIMAKRNLPKNWREILVKKYPVYDKLGMANLVNNVFFLKSTDISLTNIIEEISKEHKNKNHENR